MDSSLFPFMAKAFNEIFSKLDEFSKRVEDLSRTLANNMEKYNANLENSIGSLTKVINKIEQDKFKKEYEAAEAKMNKFIDDFHESTYYINFISALKRILSVVEDIEFK